MSIELWFSSVDFQLLFRLFVLGFIVVELAMHFKLSFRLLWFSSVDFKLVFKLFLLPFMMAELAIDFQLCVLEGFDLLSMRQDVSSADLQSITVVC